MAHITLSGVLLDPTGEFAIGDQVRFTHKSTTGETIQSAISLLTVPPNGAYSINLEYGLVLVEYNDYRRGQWRNLGVVTVNSDNPATTLPELLNAIVPVSSAELIEFQAILADAVAAQNAAAASAAAALVSQNAAAASAASIDLINDLSQAYIFETVAEYQTSTIVFPVGKTIHLNDRQADFTIIAGTGTGNLTNILANTNTTQSVTLVTSNNTNVVAFGASSSIESSTALLSSLNVIGVLNVSSPILTDPFFFDDDTKNVTINFTGEGKFTLQNFRASSVGYANYFIDADIKIKANSIDVKSITVDYDINPANVGGVALSTQSKKFTGGGFTMGVLKLAIYAEKYLKLDGATMINETGGTTKVQNAQLFTQVTGSKASHKVINVTADSWSKDGSNQDIVKVTAPTGVTQRLKFQHNTLINRNVLAGAQVDIYTGSKNSTVSDNDFINTQLHRKNNRQPGDVVLDVTSTKIINNDFLVEAGFTLASACMYFIGGKGQISGNEITLKEELTGAVIWLDAGVDDAPEQTADKTIIAHNNVYSSGNGANTEYFIKRSGPMTGYNGQVLVSNCMVDGLKRFANLLQTNDSMISNCQWTNASPVGTAVSCGILTNFTCDAVFSYEARLQSNVKNGNKIEAFLAPVATLDIENRTTVFLSSPSATITDLTNYAFNTPITFLSTTSTPISINLVGAGLVTINKYESVTYTSYHVSNSGTVRWVKST